MERIGIRELRQHASKYLERVEAGETIEVTNRGRVVAALVPPPLDVLGELIRQGKASRAKGDWNDLPPPLPARAGPSLSDILEEQRADRF